MKCQKMLPFTLTELLFYPFAKQLRLLTYSIKSFQKRDDVPKIKSSVIKNDTHWKHSSGIDTFSNNCFYAYRLSSAKHEM